MLQVDQLHQYYGSSHTLRGVSLAIEKGRCTALLGRNGVGKTTLLKCLMGVLPVAKGSITFNGRDITGRGPADIARLGLVRSFQISAVFPHLTVLENVRIALQRQRGGSFDDKGRHK